MLGLLFAARTAMAYQFQSVGTAAPSLVATLAIDFAVLGILIGCYMLPGVLVALPGGLLAQRYGPKRLVLVGLGLMALGGAAMTVTTVPFLFAGRLVSGCGAVVLNVLLTRMVADWFSGREIVAAMGTFVASWPLGIALGLVSFPMLATSLGPDSVMLAGAVACAVFLVLIAVFYRDPPGCGTGRGEQALRLALNRTEWLRLCLAGLVWGSYNVAYVVLVSSLPEFFASRGYALPIATGVTSLLGWVLILSLPLGGHVTQRAGYPNALVIGSLLLVALATLSLVLTDAVLPSLAIVVLAIGLPAGLILTLPADALSPENRSSGMGVFYTIFYAAMTILPGFAGVVRDGTGNAASPVVFAATMMGVAALGVVAFRSAETMLGRRPARA